MDYADISVLLSSSASESAVSAADQDRMRVARVVTTLVLTAHGSADPRSAANTRAVAGQLTRMRPDLDVRVAFLEQNSPSLHTGW